MKSTTVCAPVPPVAYAPGSPLSRARPRWLEFVELTKPRIAVMVLFTVAIGALLTPQTPVDLLQLLHALLGVALTACGASALNQWLEGESDSRMRRTENRPLPAGRLSSGEVLGFGVILSIIGLGYLVCTMTYVMPTALTALTLVSYVFIYTPLKRKTTLNTLIGAVPGALPPVIGWTALTGTLDGEAGVLFLIVFLWQVPHFLAIAWMYREDYARAGLKMLPALDSEGVVTGRQMFVYTVALITISLSPMLLFGASAMYGFGALGLGVFFLRFVWGFMAQPSIAQARRVLHASLVYLPGVLGLLLLERFMRFVLGS